MISLTFFRLIKFFNQVSVVVVVVLAGRYVSVGWVMMMMMIILIYNQFHLIWFVNIHFYFVNCLNFVECL